MIKARSVITMLAGGLAASAFLVAAPSAAHADLCNNEAPPGDFNVEVGSTLRVGVDTGTAGLVGVPVVCVTLFDTTTVGVGAGATVDTTSGVAVQPYLCDANTCSKFLLN